MTDLNIADNFDRDGRAFISAVVELAYADHAAGRSSARSGEYLCAEFCSEWRMGHRKMASGLYNKIRWSLAAKT